MCLRPICQRIHLPSVILVNLSNFAIHHKFCMIIVTLHSSTINHTKWKENIYRGARFRAFRLSPLCLSFSAAIVSQSLCPSVFPSLVPDTHRLQSPFLSVPCSSHPHPSHALQLPLPLSLPSCTLWVSPSLGQWARLRLSLILLFSLAEGPSILTTTFINEYKKQILVN